MPKVGKKKFAYTKKGKAAATKESKKTGKKVEMAYQSGGPVHLPSRRVSEKKTITARGSGTATRGNKFTVTKGG